MTDEMTDDKRINGEGMDKPLWIISRDEQGEPWEDWFFPYCVFQGSKTEAEEHLRTLIESHPTEWIWTMDEFCLNEIFKSNAESEGMVKNDRTLLRDTPERRG